MVGSFSRVSSWIENRLWILRSHTGLKEHSCEMLRKILNSQYLPG